MNISKILRMRSLIKVAKPIRPILNKINSPNVMHKRMHGDFPSKPFDNLPFTINNRYFTTIFFMVFFGLGFWAPFIIVWYMMAKRTF